MKIDLIVFIKEQPHVLFKTFESGVGLEMYLQNLKNKGYSYDLKLNLDKPFKKDK